MKDENIKALELLTEQLKQLAQATVRIAVDSTKMATVVQLQRIELFNLATRIETLEKRGKLRIVKNEL